MTNVELLSFVAAIASLVLAILAIWLSIVFFRMSSELSEKSTEAAKGINASVEKLEKLFDKLYADTFSMMRDTVSDMRKHIWPEESSSENRIDTEIEKRAEEKIRILKDEIEKEFSGMLHRQRVTDDKVSAITTEMGRLLEKAIVGSRKVEVEAREETIRDIIIRYINLLEQKTHGDWYVADLVTQLGGTFPTGRILQELDLMKEDGIILLSDDRINGSTKILLRAKPKT
jgi:hypothetical protein